MLTYTVVVIVLLNKGRIMLKKRRLKKKNLLAEKQEGFNSISTISEKKLSLKAQICKNLSMQDYSHSSVFVSVLTLAADDISDNNWYSDIGFVIYNVYNNSLHYTRKSFSFLVEKGTDGFNYYVVNPLIGGPGSVWDYLSKPIRDACHTWREIDHLIGDAKGVAVNTNRLLESIRLQQMWDGGVFITESLFSSYHFARIDSLLRQGRKMNDLAVVRHLHALIASSISMTYQGVKVVLPALSNALNGTSIILVGLSKGFTLRAIMIDIELANQLQLVNQFPLPVPLFVQVADFPLRLLMAGGFITGKRIAVSSLPAIYSSPKFVPMLLMKTGIIKIVPFMLKPVPSLIAKPFAIYCNTELFKTSIPLIAPIVQKKLLKF